MSKKRRTYSAEFKLETVMEGIRGDKPIAQICRERNITDSLYYKWRDQFKTHAPDIFARQDQKDQVVSEQEARIADPSLMTCPKNVQFFNRRTPNPHHRFWQAAIF